MPIAVLAKILCSPESILNSRWAHDIAHDILRAKITAELKLGLVKKRRK